MEKIRKNETNYVILTLNKGTLHTHTKKGVMCMCDSHKNDNDNKNKNKKGDEDMAKVLINDTYKKLNLNASKIREISVTPKVKDGKLLFNRKNKDHRYIVEDD